METKMSIQYGAAYFKDLKDKIDTMKKEQDKSDQMKRHDEWIESEIKKCGHDYNYFSSTYVQIDHPKRGRIPFIPYDYQLSTISQFDNNRFNIIRKCRQLGLSTTAAVYVLW
jgi:hypothetical protein